MTCQVCDCIIVAWCWGRVGAGAQGEIYAAWLMPKGREKKPVAVKKFSRAADAVQEVQMHLCAGQHPNIVELRALCQRGDELWLIMELLPRSDFCSCVYPSEYFIISETQMCLLILLCVRC